MGRSLCRGGAELAWKAVRKSASSGVGVSSVRSVLPEHQEMDRTSRQVIFMIFRKDTVIASGSLAGGP